MSHEIESEFVADWPVETSQCHHCTSFEDHSGQGFCTEAKSEVPFVAHCNFFQSKD